MIFEDYRLCDRFDEVRELDCVKLDVQVNHLE